MLCLKKVCTDELLQLAILLSILRSEHNSDLIQIPAIGIGDGDSWDFGRSLIRRDTSLHPKNPDAMMLRDEELLADLHNLGRYSRVGSLWQDVTAYMGLTSNGAVPSTSGSPQSSPSALDNHLWDTPVHLKDDSLSQEDMDLIEILWKQDVDMGFSIEGWDPANQTQLSSEDIKEDPNPKTDLENVTIEDDEDGEDSDNKDGKKEDQWAGKQYSIDLETGEYIIKDDPGSNSSVELDDDEPPSALLPDPGFSLEEALELVGLNDGFEDLLERAEGGEDETKDLLDEAAVSELEAASSDLQEQLDIIADMIQTPTYHPRPYQGRVGYSRGMSMEQRWQDLASLLSLPPEQQYGHHHLHSASHPPTPLHLPPGYHPPPAPLDHPVKTAPSAGATPETPHHYAATLAGANNVGSAVASSMNLMTNSSEPMGGEAPPVTNFKMENTHDMMYYQQQQQHQNSTSDIPHNSTEGFLSSILNDEDLQLVENIAWNEGMYTMRMLEGANAGANGGADSDSAVSSMGSERVPSLTSDTECEWTETNSDSGHTPADHYPSDYTASAFSKYKWYDYGYGSRNLSGESSSRGVAQKKHHMYGKRVSHEQSPGSVSNSSCGATGPLKMDLAGAAAAAPLTPHGSPYASPPLELPRTPTAPELKYSCSVEFSRQNLAQHVDAFIGARSTPSQIAAHNHTYHMLPESCGSHQRPLARDKKGRKTEEEQHLSRDERRARALNIPMLVDDIINLPMDEFNERLSKYDLSENQLSLIRDIRRRGKNKVAAQNCRKRKLDQILTLADEVRQMKDRKARLIHERQVLLSDRHRIKSKFAQLYRHIFQSLRDADGNPYSPYEWSLQQTANGSVILVPRGNQTMLEPEPMPPTQRKPQDHRNP